MKHTILKHSLSPIISVAVLTIIGLGLGGFWAWQHWFGRAHGTVVAVTIEPPRLRQSVPVASVRFTDITDKAGIRFRHTNGAFGKKLLPETMGSGVAFLDFDNDGNQDLLLINSCNWPGHEPAGEPVPTLALYRNKGNLEFEDVTEACGLKITLYGMGDTVA